MVRQGRSGCFLGAVIGGCAIALPAIPASAKVEVDRNLTLLQTQINETLKRLETSVGQGGPNLVQNAILGPLADKRVSTIDRIAIAIGRTAAKPNLPVQALASCTVGAGAATAAPTTAPPEVANAVATSAGHGGANFVQNAILGPLADKRVATINRVEIAIGRHAARPNLDVAALSVCSVA